MAAKYYNAIVQTDYSTSIKYRDITTLKSFVQNVCSKTSVSIIFFYLKASRYDKQGTYVGFWTERTGFAAPGTKLERIRTKPTLKKRKL
jgi:hypothetical protein